MSTWTHVAIAAVLVVLLLSASAAAQPQQHRRLLQVSTSTSMPISVNGVSSSPAPPVEATGLLDKSALTALVVSKAIAQGQALAAAQPAAQPASSSAQPNTAAAPVTIVVSQPEVSPAVLPTSTTGAINVETETPVTVRSPIEVNTREKSLVFTKDKAKAVAAESGKDPHKLLLGALALAGWANAQANTLNAAGTVTSAVGSFLNAFLPNCPPPAPGAPPIAGCQLRTAGQKALDGVAGGLQQLTQPVVKTVERVPSAAAAASQGAAGAAKP